MFPTQKIKRDIFYAEFDVLLFQGKCFKDF